MASAFVRRAFLSLICLSLLLSASTASNAAAESSVCARGNVSRGNPNANIGNNCSNETQHNDTDSEHADHVSVHVAKWDFKSVRDPYIIALVMFVTAIVKLIFHSSEALSSRIPESCLLIAFGFVIGGLISLSPTAKEHFKFTPDIFFHFLLPPIVLEAGYLMHKRYFFGNLGSILMYAVVGTLWNTFSVALGLYMISELGGVHISARFSFVECMLMGTMVAAVDPVAVLAIFDEVHVNLLLYILVFGESLLNDAVSVVLYRTAETFVKFENNEQAITADQIVLAIVSFFTISLGGTLIGVIWGMVASFITRFTDHVRVIETLLVFVCGYLAYLSAEVFHFSGIMSAISCGVVMRHYLNPNVSAKSRTTIKYCLKMISSASETVVFMFLGFASVTADFEWDTGLVLGTLAFALIFRFVGVFVLTWILNKHRMERISFVDQFVMGYGGLRGAVSFSLVLLLDEEVVPGKNAIFTALFTLIMFTVFIQGTTVKPLVHRLHVKTYQPKKPSINEQLHSKMMDHIVAGVEEIIGQQGEQVIIEWFSYYDKLYIQPILSRSDTEIVDTVLQRLEKKYHCETTHRHLNEIRQRRRMSQDVLASETVCVHTSPKKRPVARGMPTLPSALSSASLNKDDVKASVGDMLAPSKIHPMHNLKRNNVADQFDMVRLRLLRLRHMQQGHGNGHAHSAGAGACYRRQHSSSYEQQRGVSRSASDQDLTAHTVDVDRRREEWTRRRCISECQSDMYEDIQDANAALEAARLDTSPPKDWEEDMDAAPKQLVNSPSSAQDSKGILRTPTTPEQREKQLGAMHQKYHSDDSGPRVRFLQGDVSSHPNENLLESSV
eukprot:scpid37227/ scgid4286/ Sodium/hydrogen exchanger 3; Na(+)/H(+) exchanger 3; Solute carrier family 9 member 3